MTLLLSGMVFAVKLYVLWKSRKDTPETATAQERSRDLVRVLLTVHGAVVLIYCLKSWVQRETILTEF